MSGEQMRRIPHLSGLCAEQIDARYAADSSAVLVDQFGVVHKLSRHTVVGREPGEGLAIIGASISRRHAELFLDDDSWRIKDLGSTNGTFLDGHRVRETSALASEQLLVLGDVGFLFFAHGSDASVGRATESIRATAPGSKAHLGAPLLLREPTGGGGGQAEFQGQSVQLGIMQYALLTTLAQRALAERHQPEDVRGFVRSVGLLADLPWNTPYPTDNHLKQLVRRVRRALEQINLTDAIESRQRFGYRLGLEPILQ